MKSTSPFTVGFINPQGTVSFYHRGAYTPDTAFEISEEIKIKLTLPRRLGVTKVGVELLTESCVDIIDDVCGAWSGLCLGHDEYVFSLPPGKTGVGLFFLRFYAVGEFGKLYGVSCKGKIIFDFEPKAHKLVQIMVSEFAYKAPESLYGGVIYHIFVDRFCRGGSSSLSDGAVIGDFSDGIPEYPAYPGAPLKNNTFFGGTLDGITDKLDYISSLGVNAIYLSPIFESPSNHKYDTADYMTVDSGFGGEEALKRLISAAGERGIRVILDGVFNHTGSDSIYFNRSLRYNTVGAYQSKESPYYSWYDFDKYPDRYTCWWGIEILPRINPDIPECRAYFVDDGGVIDKYRSLGVYGLRLDVADELSDDFISEIKKRLDEYGESVLYGEVWEDASNKIAYGKRKRYYLGCELDGAMNYPVRRGIIDYITKKETEALRYALCEVIYNAPKRIRDAEMNLLGTHDTVRIITALAGESAEGRTNEYLSKKRLSFDERELGIKRLIAAYTVLATLPGIPAVYYGDEAGLEGYGDPFNRMPYPWGNENPRLLEHYQKIGKLRRENDVYKTGDFCIHLLNKDVLIFSRFHGDECYVTVYNNSDFTINFGFENEAVSFFEKQKLKEFALKPCEAKVFITTANNTMYIKK